MPKENKYDELLGILEDTVRKTYEPSQGPRMGKGRSKAKEQTGEAAVAE
jgi:hypothetical protein